MQEEKKATYGQSIAVWPV